MASWLERGRPALFEALSTVCNQIDADLRSELREREQKHRDGVAADLEALKSRVGGFERLEQENSALREQLSQLQQGNRTTVDEDDDHGRPDDATPQRPDDDAASKRNSISQPANTKEYHDLLKKSHILQKRFDLLNANYKSLKGAYNAKKKGLEVWKEYAEKLEAMMKSRPIARRSEPTEAEEPQPVQKDHRPTPLTRASSEVCPEIPAQDRTAMLSFSSDPGPDAASRKGDSELRVHKDKNDASGAKRSRDASIVSAAAELESTQEEDPHNIEDDGVELPTLPRPKTTSASIFIKPEPSSDGPVIIEERRVRKRRGEDLGAPRPTTRVKVESSPEAERSSTRGAAALPQDSLDLDEMGQRLYTPRKNRLLETTPGGMDFAPPSQLPTLPEKLAVRADSPEAPVTRRAVDSSALTPISSNIRIIKPTSALSKSAGKALRRDTLSGIGSLAEHSTLLSKEVLDSLEGRMATEKRSCGGRLNKLLNMAAPPEEEPSILRSAPRARASDRLESSDLLPPLRRQLPFTKDGKAKSARTSSRPTATSETRDLNSASPRKSTKRPSSEEQPERRRAEKPGGLRSKGPFHLRLDDFKINPKFNGGHDYAFSEVVRSKDDRACLAGCVDMNCCGKQFRALALAQRANAERSAAEDTKLFEEYLGDNVGRIWGMSPAEKEELWVEAKTWKLANRLGKHRHQFSRRASPPGFWNTDFPSTQEIAAEKAEAEKRERQLVEDRYREAMRPDGRWLFKDE